MVGVEQYSADIGLAAFVDVGRNVAARCETETRPGYTARVRALTDEWKLDGGYSIYSGIYTSARSHRAHARDLCRG